MDAHALRKRRSWDWGRWLPGRGVLWIPRRRSAFKTSLLAMQASGGSQIQTSAREAGLS